MNAEEKKNLVLSLIKDDLINTRLVLCLNETGLCADVYLLNLSSTVFELMGYSSGFETEHIYDAYRMLAMRVQYIDFSQSHAMLDGLVTEIYVHLQQNAEGE